MLHNELYVTAALAAALLFVVAMRLGVPQPVAGLLAAVGGFALRGAAIRWAWALPRHRG